LVGPAEVGAVAALRLPKPLPTCTEPALASVPPTFRFFPPSPQNASTSRVPPLVRFAGPSRYCPGLLTCHSVALSRVLESAVIPGSPPEMTTSSPGRGQARRSNRTLCTSRRWSGSTFSRPQPIQVSVTCLSEPSSSSLEMRRRLKRRANSPCRLGPQGFALPDYGNEDDAVEMAPL
jgi:hypothetical protein